MQGRYYHIDLAEFHKLWVGGMHINAIARHFGVTKHVIYQLRRECKVPERDSVRLDNKPDPTPEEIRERAYEIRMRRPEVDAERVEAKQFQWDGRGWTAIP